MSTRLLLFAVATSYHLIGGLQKDMKASSTCSFGDFFRADGGNASNLICQETNRNSSSENVPKFAASVLTVVEVASFYWYAIKLSSKTWGVLRNGDKYTKPFEKNVEKYCKGDQFFGFSFIAVESEFEFAGTDTGDPRRQVLLADVFYTCWGVNGASKGVSELSGNENDAFIFDYLAKKLLFYLPNEDNEELYSESLHSVKRDYCIDPNGEFQEKPHGVEACFFYLDANSIGVVYGGAMTFNKVDLTGQSIDRITDKVDWLSLYESRRLCTNPDDDASSEGLKDGECLRYLSDQDFFLFCCCYRKPELCSFDRKYLKMIKKNLKEWKYDPIEMREFDGTVYTRWTFRHFMHSDVAAAKRSKHIKHILRVHCAKGAYTMNDPGSSAMSRKLTNERLLRSTYDKNGGISRFCLKKFTISFLDSDFNRPQKIIAFYGADTSGACREEGCSLNDAPEGCFNNLIHLKKTATVIQCCCNSGDLCNHRGKHERDFSTGMFTCSSVSKSIMHKLLSSETKERIVCSRTFDYKEKKEIFLINGSSYYAPFSNRRGQLAWYDGCYRQEGFPLVNATCAEGFPFVTLQFVQCECTVFYNSSQKKYVSENDTEAKCDKKFSTFESLPREEISERPRCYSGRILQVDGEVYGRDFFVEETTDTPICVDEIFFSARGVVAYNSMTLTRYISMQKGSEKKYGTLNSELKRFAYSKRDGGRLMTILCQSNMTKICNGPKNYHDHLLPEFFAWKLRAVKAPLKPEDRKCETSPESSSGNVHEVICDRAYGCYSFLPAVGGRTTGGCLSDLYSHVALEATPTVASLCEEEEDDAVSCRIIEDTTGVKPTGPGTLCCCRHGYRCNRENFVEYRALLHEQLHKEDINEELRREYLNL